MNLLVLTMTGYQDIELISFIGVLNTSGKIKKITYWNPDGIDNVFGSQNIGSIKSITNNVDINEYDAIFIPGGHACVDLRTNKKALDLIKQFIESNKYVFAICDAPNAIVESGMQLDKKYVSYPIEDIEKTATNLRQKNNKTCVDGKYITGNCPASSIEFGLVVLETLYGKEIRDKVWCRISGGCN